uniref:Amyloid-beta A4 precursor protein-binding family A member 3 n=1 Tax=Neolamprologus brichardi TaxID=32507 RepID=A0A3Q4MN65_NEOBR
MAHGKRPGSISKILVPGTSSCPGPGQSKEERGGLVNEATEQPPCALEEDNNDQLTSPVSANHYYMSCDPSPEDMEDTCSEYDNVGSDVEQDYDEVLHLNREGGVDMRYYKQYCPEDGGYIKHAVSDNINENTSAPDQMTPRPRRGTEICEGSQSDAKPSKMSHRFRSHCAPVAGDETEGGVKKDQEDRFFFGDGDEIEEVLDGAKFIEDLEETEDSIQRQASLYQGNENERIRKGGEERQREGDVRVTRNPNVLGASKKCEPSHMDSKEKERQGKGDCKKVAVRTKARSSSSKQHPIPPPRHSHAQPPTETQKPQPHREPPPVPRPSNSTANSRENEPRVIKPSLAPLHTPEQQRESLEERQRRLEKPQQVSNANRTHLCQLLSPGSFCHTVPGPCEPEDLIDGIIFAANYLGCTQVLSDKNPSKSVRMSQAHEAVSQIKVILLQDEDSQMMTEVDLFISTKAVKVLNADTQETMMDSALRTISYIADIGSIVVLMARRRMSQASSEELSESSDSTSEGKSQYRMICYVFESEDAQLIAQSIGQAFSVAYREFLRANGINPTDLSQKQYSDIISSQEMYHDDLVHFSNSDNCKELYIEKQKGEILGVVIVESGWGSILPTVILASMLNSGPAARSGKLSVGDQIMSINDTSLVGLPLATCQGIIKGLKNQVKVKLSIVSCPPVTTVLIKRPDLKFQLGFSVQNGIICSLMRGGIAERGGVRVGHRIIEINGQSVVAMAHEKIVQTLSISVGEINMKTMPAVMFRLLTGQETPVYI